MENATAIAITFTTTYHRTYLPTDPHVHTLHIPTTRPTKSPAPSPALLLILKRISRETSYKY